MLQPILRRFLSPQPWTSHAIDLTALLLRVGCCGLMFYNHGLDKWNTWIKGEGADWPDPLGVGAAFSLFGTVLGETVCAFLMVIGLFTRFAAVYFCFVMCVVAFALHWKDPLYDKEHALLFVITGMALFILGPGRYSIDAWWARKREVSAG